MTNMTINGVRHVYDGDPDLPLLWYLRDELGLRGTRFGCGASLCGACTVHVDGMATRACCVTLSDLEGASIKTIEGLTAEGPHPLQLAWIDLDVPQCGYCQPGQIMQAAALLAVKDKPSDADIDEAMSGNICRCGTYPRIRAAIKQAAFGRQAGGLFENAPSKMDLP
jgi:isoquinoline 1-oxidoreductase subunit alpha